MTAIDFVPYEITLLSTAYFLINDEVRFYFEQPNLALHFREEEVKLTPKEAQTLKFALENRHKDISPEEIAVHLWGKDVVEMDYANKKGQAITHVSKVRRRIEQLGYRKQWLVTKESKGYRVVCSVECISDEILRQQEIEKELKEQHQLKRKEAFKYVSSSVMITIVSVMLLFWMSNKDGIQVENVTQLATLSGVSAEPKFSPDGKAITFSYEFNDDLAEIYLKLDSDINYRVLTRGHFDQAPSFSPSGRRLAFNRFNKDSCEIRVVELDEHYHLQSADRHVADCDLDTGLSNSTWLDDEQLLFTDRMEPDEPLQVFKVNINTKARSLYLPFEREDYFGSGYYFIDYNPQKQKLILLDAYLWNSAHIYQQVAGGPVQFVKEIKNIAKSVGVLDDGIIFNDIDNQLKYFALSSPNEVQLVYSNPLTPMTYPYVDSSGKRIVFVTGDYHRTSIHRYDLVSGESVEVVSSKSRLYLPKASRDELLVLSKETGVRQIYAYTNNRRFQLTDYKNDKKIVNFVSSKDKQWLAVNFLEKTVLYKRDSTGLTEVETFELASYPRFSPKGNHLLLTEQIEQTIFAKQPLSRLVEYDLSKYEQTQQLVRTGLAINDAVYGAYHQNGIIYTPSDRKGLYNFTIGSNTLLNDEITASSADGFAVSNGKVYLLAGNYQFVVVDITSRDVSTLPKHLYGDFSISGDGLFYLSQSRGNSNIVSGDIVKQ